MRSEIQTETAPAVHSNDNFPSSAKHASDASHALYAGSYATSSAAQMSRTLSLHSVQSGISSSQRDSSKRSSHHSNSDDDTTAQGPKSVYEVCAEYWASIPVGVETPATLSRFSKALELIETQLPNLAKEAALLGESSVTVLPRATHLGGDPFDPVVSEHRWQLVAAIEAQGFKPVYTNKGPHMLCDRLPVRLTADWDREHRPDLAQVTADARRQKRLDAIAARPPEANHCADIYASDAGTALDDGRLPDALQLLQNCAVASTGFMADRDRFQTFVWNVNEYELNGTGLDLKLTYDSSFFDSYFVDGFEIK